MPTTQKPNPLNELANQIKHWGKALGFSDVGITDTHLDAYTPGYFKWLAHNFHGQMHYMAQNIDKRTQPNLLVDGTLRVISCRMNYFDDDAQSAIAQLKQDDHAYISRYALNKDYHKLMRKRLTQLAEKINAAIGQPHQYRAFSDSAPVLERPLAQKAGLGFVGKNSLIIHPRAGSYFFLGELYTNLPLPIDPPFDKQGCGPCTACLQECPTQAIIEDGVVDANRCISYLTIEYKGIIPEPLRALMGNRIYGCDDCQLVCPWNKFGQPTTESAFKYNRLQLDKAKLLELLSWHADLFLKNFEGSPIRRIGFECWQRNLCVALGNASYAPEIEQALNALAPHSELVKVHLDWAIAQQTHKKLLANPTESTRPGANSAQQAAELKPWVAKKYYLPATIKTIKH